LYRLQWIHFPSLAVHQVLLLLLLLLFLLLPLHSWLCGFSLFAADDRQALFKVLSGQQQLPSHCLSLTSSSNSNSSSSNKSSAAARKVWEEAAQKVQASWSAAGSSSSSSGAGWPAAAGTVSYEEADLMWQQLLHLAGQNDGPRFDQVLLANSSSSSSDDLQQQQLQKLQRSLQTAFGLEEQQLQELAAVGSSSSSSSSIGLEELQRLQEVFAAPPTLEQVLQQRWQEVSLYLSAPGHISILWVRTKSEPLLHL
jgi:hypothetical protein